MKNEKKLLLFLLAFLTTGLLQAQSIPNMEQQCSQQCLNRCGPSFTFTYSNSACACTCPPPVTPPTSSSTYQNTQNYQIPTATYNSPSDCAEKCQPYNFRWDGTNRCTCLPPAPLIQSPTSQSEEIADFILLCAEFLEDCYEILQSPNEVP